MRGVEAVLSQLCAVRSTSGAGEQACPTSYCARSLNRNTELAAGSKREPFPRLGWKE